MNKVLCFGRPFLVVISFMSGCAGDGSSQSSSVSDTPAVSTETVPTETVAPGSGMSSAPALTLNGDAGSGATPTEGPSAEAPSEAGSGGMASGGQPESGGAVTGEAGSGATSAAGMGGTAGTGGTAADAGETGVPVGGGEAGAAPTSGSAGAGGSTEPTRSSGCGNVAGLVNGRSSIDINGTMREYILRLPDDYDSEQPYKLIFGWHQLAGSAESIANRGYYGLEAPSAGQAILVAPEGLVGNDRGDKGWWNNDGEDVDFYFSLLELLTSELCVDQQRIFSTGFSFGAMFSFSLACTEGSMMRAIAPQAGSAFGGCGNGAGPVATLGFVGVNDSLLSGHRQAMDGLGERNGCSGEPVELSMSWCDGLGDNNLPCTCVEYQNCDAGYPVIACEYEAGHTFAPNSGETIWAFFAQF